MHEITYMDKKVVDLSKLFVNAVAHRETKHGSVDVLIGREKKTVCKAYPSITCEDHVAMDREATGKYFQGNIGTPTTVFLDPSGKELSRKVGGMSSSELLKELQAIVKKVGPILPLDPWKALQKTKADAEAAVEKKEYKKAVPLYQKLAKHANKTAKQWGEEGLSKIIEEGRAQLSEVDGIGDPEEAKKRLKKIIEDFKGTPASDEAKKKLEALGK